MQNSDTLFMTMSDEENNLLRLWMLRILVPLGGHKYFISDRFIEDDNIANFIGIGQSINDDYCPKKTRRLLFSAHSESTIDELNYMLPNDLNENIKLLSDFIDLNEVDRRILGFIILINDISELETCTDYLGKLNTNRLISTLSAILDVPRDEVKFSFSPAGGLGRSRLVEIDMQGAYSMSQKLNILSHKFCGQMMEKIDRVEDIFKDVICLSPKPSLGLNDYGYMREPLSLLCSYLDAARKENKKGVNILLYGPPGTGKTELTRVISSELNATLYEITTVDSDNNSANARGRIRAYSSAQVLFSENEYFLLFDEIEDIFNDGGFFSQSTAQKSKGWINQMLEGNSVPTFWVTNDHSCLDSAFIRRFDMVLEMGIPSGSKRLEIMTRLAGSAINNSTIEKLAASKSLAPAIVERAISVASLAIGSTDKESIDHTVLELVNNTLKTQGHKKLSEETSSHLPDYYSLQFLNSSLDLYKLKDGIQQSKRGRLCLYGPPGTGKTAYVHWLSREIGVPIVSKTGSDLLSPYVGGTEHNLNKAFEEAMDEKAILLLDEIDSFLQDRRGARNSWEVTQVNELLKQMEVYEGILFTATNLVDNLDQAALRRFDIKLQFDYLSKDQAALLLAQVCTAIELGEPSGMDIHKLNKIEKLTPGDFSVISRRNQFMPFHSIHDVINGLVDEYEMKEGGKQRAIGF